MAQSETRIVEQCKDWFKSDMETAHKQMERARENFRFYTGIQQWDAEIVERLAAEGRPALTINRILSTVNTLSGHQRDNRSDIKLFPRRGGTQPIADLGTELIKHAMDVSGGQYELSDCFDNGIISGYGWISVRVDWSNDPVHGDLLIENESPFDIVEDQDNRRYDLNRGNRVAKIFWWDRKQIELQFPDKVSRLREATDSPEWNADKEPFEDERVDYEADAHTLPGGADAHALSKTKYRVREYWWKQWERVTFLVNIETLSIVRLPEKKAKIAGEIIAAYPDMRSTWRIIERPAEVLHMAAMVGDMLLEHTVDPLRGITMFPFFRFCPYWSDGYAFGVVDNLKGAQTELNKRRSQALHSLNQTANSGWKAKALTPRGREILELYGAKPNLVLDEREFGGSIEKIEPNRMDQGHFLLAQQAGADIKDISGVNSDLLGTNPRESESGRARLIRQEAGLKSTKTVFDNFSRTVAGLGSFLWEVIRNGELYSEAEIRAIVQDRNLKAFYQRDPQTRQPVIEPVTGQPILDLTPMREWRFGRYGVRVGRSVSAPTVRAMNFEQMLEAAKSGIPVPPDLLIEMSDWPNKDEIIERIRQAQQQTPPMVGAGT